MNFKFILALIFTMSFLGMNNLQAGASDDSVCDDLEGRPKGLCRWAMKAGCGVLPTESLRTCTRLEQQYREVTNGEIPPWLVVPNPDDTAQLTPVNVSVPFAPQPVRGTDGTYHLAYELQILNFGTYGANPAPPPPASIVIQEIAIFGDDPDIPIETLGPADIEPRMQLLHLSARFPGMSTIELQPAQSAIVFLDITFVDRDEVPEHLTHRVTIDPVSGTGPDPEIKIVETLTKVDPTPIIVIGPYLRGGNWANFNGCCDYGNSAHRRVVRSVDGAQYSPERSAQDFLKADWSYRVVLPDTGDEVEDWFGYGEEVISVADGVVTRVVTGLPDNPMGTFPFPPTIDEGGGNEVLVEIEDGIFAMYGHLIPGSITLQVGDRVSRGDVIGLLGNTGVTTAPHLHFQIMDRNSIAESEGLPFVIDEFEVLGTFDGITEEGVLDNLDLLPSAELRHNEMPLQNSIIRFP